MAEPANLILFEKEIQCIQKNSARLLSSIPNATMDYNLARISIPDASLVLNMKLYRGSFRSNNQQQQQT